MKISLLVLGAVVLSLSLGAVGRGEEADKLSTILVAGDDWKVIVDDVGFADGASADAEGNFYFSDLHKPAAIYKVATDGTKTKVTDAGMSGTKIGPDGRLYACGGGKVIVVDLADGKQTVIAEDMKTNDIAMNHRGQIYITETGKKQVTFVDIKTGKTQAADVGINKPNGIGFLPGGTTLLVSDYGGVNVYSFSVHPDGTLTDKKPYATMKTPEGKPDVAGGDGMTIDADGRAYVTTAIGLQIFDAKGALLGVLPKPQVGPLTNAAFVGKDHDLLCVTCGTKVFGRKTRVKGLLAFAAPASSADKK
jgi:gluconolactonase